MANLNPNFQKIVKELTPHFLQGGTMIKFMNSWVNVLQTLNDSFYSWRSVKIADARRTAQTMYLQQYLNSLYDPTLKRIYITNQSANMQQYVYNVGEDDPNFYLLNVAEYGDVTYFYNNSEIVTIADYIINIPVSITFVESIVRSQVDVYNVAGKEYEIQTF